MIPLKRTTFAILAASAFAASLCETGLAQTAIEWTSSSSASWNTAANWTPANIPNSATEYAQFGAVTNGGNAVGIGSTSITVGAVEMLSTRTANMTIFASGTTGAALEMTLAGVTINSVANTILRNNSSNNLIFAPNNNQASANTLQIVLGPSTSNINIDGSGGINIGVAINGSGKNLTFNGASSGVLTFSGAAANGYDGTTTVAVGQLDLSKTASTTAIAGALTIGDGAGAAESAFVRLVNANQIANSTDVTLRSDGRLGLNNNNETIDGLYSNSSAAVVSLGTGTLTVGANNDTTASYAGSISGAGGSLTKIGTGTQTLSGLNTFGGTTTIGSSSASGGTLIVNSNLNGAVAVNAGTLQGIFSTPGAVTVGDSTEVVGGSNDAFIAPGNSTGTITTTNSLTLNSDATYVLELNSTTQQSDRLVADGVTLNSPDLQATDLNTMTLAQGTFFTIIQNTSATPTSGQFAGLPEGSTLNIGANTYQITYQGNSGLDSTNNLANDVLLVAVPEPSTYAMLGLGAALLIGIQRFRRNKS